MTWDDWEDWLAGMYEPTNSEDWLAAARLLRDPDQFREAAREMIREWPHATRHNLGHMWSGRNAWVGQATCCYSLGLTAADTRRAWGTMSLGDQWTANQVARDIRAEWERTQVDAQAQLAL